MSRLQPLENRLCNKTCSEDHRNHNLCGCDSLAKGISDSDTAYHLKESKQNPCMHPQDKIWYNYRNKMQCNECGEEI